VNTLELFFPCLPLFQAGNYFPFQVSNISLLKAKISGRNWQEWLRLILEDLCG
jgi:hypothetical protein